MNNIVFNDLREYIEEVKKVDKYKIVEDADWNLEIGVLTELWASIPNSPLIIFDKIKGYPPGYRIATNVIHTPRRFALIKGLPLEATGVELVSAWREKVKSGFKPVPVKKVETGPVTENVHLGDDVDLFEFPTPKWHELDGGRYIGTGVMVVQKDPDDGWVNLGTYRVQVHDKSVSTIYISPGRHGDIIRRKYWDRGLNCPAAVVCGQDPLLYSISAFPIPRGISEYDYAGWIRSKPIEVIEGPTTGLPIPATAEIVLEGEIMPPGIEYRDEGPFGEWTGYYASGVRKETVFKIKAILHRNDPIILGAPPLKPTINHFQDGSHIIRSAQLWDDLDKQVPGVKGVWIASDVGPKHMAVAAIEQKYGGHAKQTAMVVGGSYTIAYMNKLIIIVDDDIDPSNLSQVMWAICTRRDLEDAIEIVKHRWGSVLNPSLSPERIAAGNLEHSGAIILACKPYHWIKKFPPAIATRPELVEKIKRKWQKLLQD